MDYRLLLVDDEPALREMVGTLLRKEGWFINTAACCEEALALAEERRYHLILLDVMLPDGDGFSLFTRFRALPGMQEIPVIFLSARDEDRARLRGLGLGADDYITKPFLPEELLLRLRGVLRRTYREPEVLTLGSTRVSFASGEVIRGEEIRMLTAKEHAILQKLAENRGRIVTIDALCQAVWPEGNYGLESSLMVHIRHLREKIEEDPSNPLCLLTVRGLGYKLVK